MLVLSELDFIPEICIPGTEGDTTSGKEVELKANAKTGMFDAMLQKVRSVPRGRVATYGDIAYAAGYPGAARQVAWALHSGAPDVPWQRIVGAGGAILLTGEHGLEQRLRLQAEGVSFLGIKVNMAAHRHSFLADQQPHKKRQDRQKQKPHSSQKKA